MYCSNHLTGQPVGLPGLFNLEVQMEAVDRVWVLFIQILFVLRICHPQTAPVVFVYFTSRQWLMG